MAMYHSWGSQNAWLRQIHGKKLLYVSDRDLGGAGVRGGRLCGVTSPTGEIVVPLAHMAALNRDTVWTWNAIGKRRGAWALDEGAAEANQGFLLNHLISEVLPGEGRVSNSDPVTGQAAWSICGCGWSGVGPREVAEPVFDAVPRVVPKGRGRA